MKRLVSLVALVGVLALGVAYAFAAPANIIGTGANTFSAPSYAHDAGTVATLTVTGSSHNVTANSTGLDGKALFRSSTIGGGTTGVNGTQYLAPGGYPFRCTVHPSTMNATLNVAGTPLPRPAVTVKILSKTLGGKIKTRVTSTSANGSLVTGSILAKLGKTTLTKDASLAVSPLGSQTIKLKLSTAGKNKLAGRSSAKIKVTATPDFGSPVTAKKTLK